MQAIETYLNEHQQNFENDLFTFLRIPSVSAQSKHNDDTKRAATFVADQLQRVGVTTEVVPTKGHPIVYGEWLGAKDKPTVLVYGHYDVQPPEPLNEWITGPFEPTIRNGNVHARGAVDDKGQMLTHLKSVEAWLRTEKKLPVNLKFLIEGEEEVGSANLDQFIDDHQDRLHGDWVVISDTAMFAPDLPSLCYGLRGIAYFELIVRGPKFDLHSGGFGGMVNNPANVLAAIIASLKDNQGRILIEGFNDNVRPFEPWERAELAKLPFSEKEWCQKLGIDTMFGEKGYSVLERKWARPTCDVCGLYGGYAGEGSKTIIPAVAGAKVSFRLVPDQKIDHVAKAFRAHVQEHTPPGVRVEVIDHHHAPPVLVPVQSAGVEAAKRALLAGFGKEPVFIRNGGSIPIVSTFKDKLGLDSLLVGFGLPDDGAHSPNEKFSLRDFHRGIKTSAYLWKELAN